MKFWVGVTDNAWYQYLKSIQADEVNFWQPSARAPFKNASVGMPFLFKLKRPHNHIAGGGFFVTYSDLPLEIAWEAFGEKNGRATFGELRSVLADLRGQNATSDFVGCTVLANVVYFDESTWLPSPPGWSPNIVVGKSYETSNLDGRQIWSHVRDLLSVDQFSQPVAGAGISARAMESVAAYGTETTIQPRLGQGAFRVLVTDAYKRRCAITGETTLVALEAAHIISYSKDPDHCVNNGLLLRADYHRLYDVGLVGVTQDLQVKVSPRIREAWSNGKVYYRLDGQPLAVLPEAQSQQPDRDRLRWHYENVFQA